MPGLGDVTEAQWAALARRPVFFGHQSVGYNVMAGVSQLLAEHRNIPLTVIESREPAAGAPAIYHATAGRNDHPLEKFDDFAAVAAGMAAPGSIAMVKLCYVDIHRHTDVPALFAEYQKRMSALRAKQPGLTLVHVTTPVTSIENWKGRLRAALKRHATQRERNAARHRYNELMRQAYQGREPVFDLAMLEATAVDGRTMTFGHDGESVPYMAPGYTSDGGHLNTAGQRLAAERLLVLLACGTV